MWKTIKERMITRILVLFSRWFFPAVQLLNIKQVVSHPKRILIHLPENLEATRFHKIQNRLKQLFPSSALHYLINDFFPAEWLQSPTAGRPVGAVHVIRTADIRWVRLLKEERLDELRSGQFDLAVDFDLRFNLTVAHAFYACGAMITVALYHPRIQDVFHNVLIKVSDPLQYDTAVFRLFEQLKT